MLNNESTLTNETTLTSLGGDGMRAFAIAAAVRCVHTAAHAERVAKGALRLGLALGVEPVLLGRIELAGLLHDVGKIGTPDAILYKPGPLDEEEWALMRAHPALGARMLDAAGIDRRAGAIVRAHHEHLDGAGYPDGLSRHGIPLGARILSVVDAYDAMRSHRPYRASFSRQEAVRRLVAAKGTQFQPTMVETFLDLLPIQEPREEGEPMRDRGRRSA